MTQWCWFAAGDVAQFVLFVERPWCVFPTECCITKFVFGGAKHKLSKPRVPPPLETSAGRLRGTNPLPWAPLDEATNLDRGFGRRKAVVAWLVKSFPRGVVPKKNPHFHPWTIVPLERSDSFRVAPIDRSAVQ